MKIVNFRASEEWIDLLDKTAKEYARKTLTPPSKSAVIRRAVAEFAQKVAQQESLSEVFNG